MRKASSLVQITGVVSCVLFLILLGGSIFQRQALPSIFLVLMLFLNALAFQSLFERDDTPLGRFFYRIGTFASLRMFDLYVQSVKDFLTRYGHEKNDPLLKPQPGDDLYVRRMREQIKREDRVDHVDPLK